MTMSKRFRFLLLAGIICGGFVFVEWLGGLELGERASTPGVDGFPSTAEARVGRPLTPVSVAGVARRTSRRTTRRVIRRTTVYVATLPRGCQTVIIDGTSLYYCGGTYYQAYGTQYVIVNVE